MKLVISKIVKREILPQHYNDHALSGKLRDQRDCHVEPDFILLYKIKDDELILIRLGSHSELFK
ncbi:MAG: type II toxin-antitoxin system YafQ family toxin [Bacteroidetes bacterium]|nr:type II toxin-antitoxin system YafQ family toxin [Bacteroidota bacterium]